MRTFLFSPLSHQYTFIVTFVKAKISDDCWWNKNGYGVYFTGHGIQLYYTKTTLVQPQLLIVAVFSHPGSFHLSDKITFGLMLWWLLKGSAKLTSAGQKRVLSLNVFLSLDLLKRSLCNPGKNFHHLSMWQVWSFSIFWWSSFYFACTSTTVLVTIFRHHSYHYSLCRGKCAHSQPEEDKTSDCCHWEDYLCHIVKCGIYLSASLLADF